MSDSDPIDLSHLQQFNLRPDWVEDLESREATPGEVVWGRDSGEGPPSNASLSL